MRQGPFSTCRVRRSRLAGCLGCDVQETSRQALHVLRVLQDQREGFGGVQNVVAELGAEFGQFLLDGVEAFLFFALQPDARQFGIAQQHLDNALLGRVAILPGSAVSQLLQRLINGLALSQPHEELHDFGLYFLVGAAQFLTVLDAHQVPHDAPSHPQTVPEAFERLNQPRPRGLRVRLQELQFDVEFIQNLPHGRRHVLGANAVEGGENAAFQERICGRGLGFIHGMQFLIQVRPRVCQLAGELALPIHRAGMMPRAVMVPMSRKVSW